MHRVRLLVLLSGLLSVAGLCLCHAQTVMLDLPRRASMLWSRSASHYRHHHQLPPSAGQRPPNLGQSGALRRGLARRSQRKYHRHV